MNTLTKKNLYEVQNTGFTWFLIISYLLYAAALFGVSRNAPMYISTIDYYVKIYVCLFLIYRFNPFRTNIEFTELDRRIVFSSGLFLLTTTAINQIAIHYFDFVKQKITNQLHSNNL